jgi:protein O-mannosyl-transferase
VLTVIVVLMSFKTIDRNRAWKNDSTLFGTDIKTVPNSVLVNANVAASYITLADYAKDSTEREKYLRDAVKILDHTLTIHTKFVAAYLNRGIAWYKLGNIDKTVENINHVRTLYPTYPTLPGMYKLICDYYLKIGWEQYGKQGRYSEAVEVYKRGLQVDSTSVDLWYNMGGAYYTNKQPAEAIMAFQKALTLQPDNKQAREGLNAAAAFMNGQAPPAQGK